MPDDVKCSRCGGRLFASKGYRSGKKRLRCKGCGLGCSVPLTSSTDTRTSSRTYTAEGDFSQISIDTDKRITNERELIEVLEIDTEVWELVRFKISTPEAFRKDRSVEWKVTNGIVENGEVHDTGKLLVKTLYHVQAWFRRKTVEIREKSALEDLKKDVLSFSPKYPAIKYPKLTRGLLLEVEMPDIHVGKMTWEEESGENSDLKSQSRRVTEVLAGLLAYARNYPVDRILLPLGSDYFNVDTKFNTTTGGTPQQEDTRWRKTFRAGRVLAVSMIDSCSTIAPVDVLIIPGNHDEQRSFYLGDVLEAWYRNSPNVRVDNSARSRKYYQYGKCLIGLIHGGDMKPMRLAGIMAQEAPSMWAETTFREWHMGDKHHKEDLIYKTNEQSGIVMRILRSLTPTDAWHYDKGFVGSTQASEAFLWSKEDGLVAQFTVPAKKGE